MVLNIGLTGYSTDKAGEFLAKALEADKKQRQIIKKLYDDRVEVVANFSTDLVKQALSSTSFLDSPEGRKLAAYFLLDNLECYEFLEFIREQVKSHDPSRAICEHWGELVVYAWKIAPDALKLPARPNNNNDEDEDDGDENRNVAGFRDDDEISKAKIETEIIQDLFHYSIIYPKRYAQKFAWIVDGFLPETSSKKFSAMFFRCLLPVLWRNLEAVNEDVRLAASRLLLKLYPLHAEDSEVNAEYLQKQNVAMEAMLMDDCVAIRVDAIKKVLLHLRIYWTSFPRYIIKVYLGKIVDELSMDAVDEVRVAVFEGMAHLAFCSQAIVAMNHSMEILAPRGINDKSAKVRLAAFKLLNTLIGHRNFHCFSWVKMENILLRLDFEHSEAVQRQIVRLIYKSFCPKVVDGIDFNHRFARIRYMCKVSRNASLNFHRHLYSLKLVSCNSAVHHIQCIMLGVKAHLRGGNRQRRESEALEDTVPSFLNEFDASSFSQNDTHVSLSNLSMSTVNQNGSEANRLMTGDQAAQKNTQDFQLMKNLIDSAIVLWMTLRYDLYNKYANELRATLKIMESILRTLELFLNTNLLDSALVIASNLPTTSVQKSLQDKVLRSVSGGAELSEFEAAHLNCYIEAFSNWNMVELIKLINDGLEELYKAVACDARGAPLRMPAPRPAALFGTAALEDETSVACSSESERDSPPSKRGRRRQQPKGKSRSSKNPRRKRANDRRPLDHSLKLLNMLLSIPSGYEKLKKDGFNIVQFYHVLKDIRRAFGIRLQLKDFRTREDINILVNCYETLTLLSLIIKSVERDDVLLDESSTSDVDDIDVTMVEAGDHSTVNGSQITAEESTMESQLRDQQNRGDRHLLSELSWMRKVMRDTAPDIQIVKMFLRCVNLHLDCSQLSSRVLKQTTDVLFEIFGMGDAGREIHECVMECAKHLSSALQYCEDDRLMVDGLQMRLKQIQNDNEDSDEVNEEGFE